MAEHECILCGNRLQTKGNGKVCESCKVAKCSICGAEVHLSGAKLTKYIAEKETVCSRKCSAERTRRRLLESEGVENVAQRGDVRQKLRETRLRDSDETKAKRSASLRISCNNEDVKEKRKATNLERYGVESVLQLDDVHSSGVDAARSIKSKQKRVATVKDRYDVSNTFLLGHPGIDSSIERRFASLLDERNISYEREVRIGQFFYDFVINDVCVEIDPWIWHNATYHPYGSIEDFQCCSPDYHSRKKDNAVDNGYRCIHVFDWDDYGKIADMFIQKECRGAREFDVVEYVDGFDKVNRFLDSYHLQGRCRHVEVAYSLEEGDTIYGVMTFGRARYNSSFDYELLRYCVDPRYAISGGAERLFSHFRKSHYGRLLSYSDNAKFIGGVYPRLGFSKDTDGEPTVHWYNPKDDRHITDALLRQRGADQLLGTSFGKGSSNRDIMIENGFVEIYDCGQSRWSMDIG